MACLPFHYPFTNGGLSEENIINKNKYKMKTIKFFTVCIGVFLFLGKTQAKDISFDALIVQTNIKSTIQNNFDPNDPKYGKDSVTCVRNLSLYREFYRQRNFNDALDPWRWVFFNCPMSSQNMYLDGAVLVKNLFNADRNPENKEKYIDTLMMVYDQRIKAFGREGFVLGRKGVDMFYMSPNRVENAFKTLGQSIEIEKNATKPDVVVAYFQAGLKLSETEKYTKEIVINAYMKVTDIIDYNIKNNTADTSFITAKSNIELMFAPIATCPDLVNIYSQKFSQEPQNKELLELITAMLNKYGCQEEELFFKATESLHKVAPSANSAFLMGNMLYAKKQFSKAAEYFQEAARLFKEDENDKKADALLLLSEIYFRNLNQLVRARSFALQALEVRPNDGRPLLLIGDMYASSAASCGENELEKKVAYWAAVDKYIRARNVDNSSSVENAANQRIATWSQHFPNDETIFFHGLQKGQSYTVGCWINETTTVR